MECDVSFRRVKRTVIAAGSVVLSYLAYAMVAVPLIEPSIKIVESSLPSNPTPERPRFEDLFPPGSWELSRPKILETEQGTLLFDDYQPLDNHRKMRLKRCTFIRYIARKESAAASDKLRLTNEGRPIIMRAAAGAVLDFDSMLDLGRGQFGKLIGGQLSGEVTISSPPSAAGANDAFRFTTRDVQIDTRRVWTPHEVDFEYGPNRGHGSDLRIEWTQTAASAAGDRNRSALGGIRSLELVHVERLTLQTPAGDPMGNFSSAVLGGGAPVAKREQAGRAKTSMLDVTCRGPLRVEFPQYLATLSEAVRVVRNGEGGPPDQLEGDLLEIHFGPGDGPPPRDGPKEVPAMRIERVVVEGRPATLRIPGRQAEAIGAHLEYDLVQRTVRMNDPKQVRVSDGQNQIEASALEYSMGAAGRLGQFWAKGPGRLRAASAAGGRELTAQWLQEVRLRRHEDIPVLTLWKGEVTVAGTEHFAADEVHLFLAEIPKPGKTNEYDVQPDRMKAIGNVTLDSSRLTGSVREASLWFVRADSPQTQAQTQTSEAAAPGDQIAALTGASSEAASKFELKSETLQAQIGMSQPPRLERLTLQNQVHFQQIAGDATRAVTLDGDLFELLDGHTQNARAVLVGRPAHIAIGQTQMTGTELRLSQADNTLDVVGAGNMTLPALRKSTAPLPPVQVDWLGGMRFDGRTAIFNRQIEVRGSMVQQSGDVSLMHARSASLRVTLTDNINFARPETARKTDVEELAFDTDVFLQSETLDPSQQRKAFQQTEAKNLVLNQTTGDMHATGPGWISSVHMRQATGRAEPAGILPSSSTGIEYMRVQFLREVTGKMQSGQIEFHERVRAVYGPVQTWEQTLDDSRPPGPGDQFVLLTSDRLSVTDMSERPGNFKDVELQATGNALVRGGTFQASAERIAYVRSKDQLIAEGDGRSDAVLNYQPPQLSAKPGELKAGKIIYCPSTRQFKLNNFQRLDVQDLQQLVSPTRRP
jgi:lipopolysaccharide export system protein LptA